jgi:hypothetical protein
MRASSHGKLAARGRVSPNRLGDLVEIYGEPGNKGYRKLSRPETSETIAPALISLARLPMTEIWPT